MYMLERSREVLDLNEKGMNENHKIYVVFIIVLPQYNLINI